MLDRLRTQFEVKTVDQAQRVIAGYAAVHSNVDRVADIIDPSASVKAVARLSSPRDVGVFIGHNTATLPVGIPTKIVADSKGLYTETKIFDGPTGDDLLAVAKGLEQHGQKLGMSIGYRIHAQKPERSYGKLVRRLMDYELREYSFAAPQMIANPEALVVAVKTMGGMMTFELKVIGGKHCIVKTDDDTVIAEFDTGAEASRHLAALYDSKTSDKADGGTGAAGAGATGDKATWDTAYVNNLPNSAFMYVEPGDDDGDGKRVPRSKRHFPIRDSGGKVDEAHLRNAIGRIPQSNAPGLDDAAKKNLQARARRMLEQMQGGKTVADEPTEWAKGAPLKLAYIAYRLLDVAQSISTHNRAMAALGDDVKGFDRILPDNRHKIEDLQYELKDVLALAVYVDQNVDGAAEVDVMRRQLDLLGVSV